MKIAILGSAPSSVTKAPFGDTSWKIWACSPGCYPHLTRIDEFWEVHRWEPGVIGKPMTQKPWFSPEYVQWLKTVPPVLWVADPAAAKDCPNAKMIPIVDLISKYGHYVWTSSVAYMMARAINVIQEGRAARAASGAKMGVALVAGAIEEEDVIGLWGVDMAANEELYTAQRAACQFFMQVLVGLGIKFFVPPESDLLTPPPMYGFSEISHKAIKWLERKRELEARLAQVNGQAEAMRNTSFFLQGAIDDLDYMQKMWMHEGEDTCAFQFEAVFPEITIGRQQSAVVRSIPHPPIVQAEPLPEGAVTAATPPTSPAAEVKQEGVDPLKQTAALDMPDAGIR